MCYLRPPLFYLFCNLNLHIAHYLSCTYHVLCTYDVWQGLLKKDHSPLCCVRKRWAAQRLHFGVGLHRPILNKKNNRPTISKAHKGKRRCEFLYLTQFSGTDRTLSYSENNLLFDLVKYESTIGQSVARLFWRDTERSIFDNAIDTAAFLPPRKPVCYKWLRLQKSECAV